MALSASTVTTDALLVLFHPNSYSQLVPGRDSPIHSIHSLEKSSVKHPGKLTSTYSIHSNNFNPASGRCKATQTTLLQTSVEQDSSSPV
ncbi:hypothetical protein SLA2020_285310 [Shorea laevis]